MWVSLYSNYYTRAASLQLISIFYHYNNTTQKFKFTPASSVELFGDLLSSLLANCRSDSQPLESDAQPGEVDDAIFGSVLLQVGFLQQPPEYHHLPLLDCQQNRSSAALLLYVLQFSQSLYQCDSIGYFTLLLAADQ